MSKPLPFKITDLHPLARPKFAAMMDNLKPIEGFDLRPFEGYRTPQRQAALVKLGTSKSGPWRSAHQFGLAVDFVPFRPGTGWTWEAPDAVWTYLRAAAEKVGLEVPIKWDRCHVMDSKAWATIRHAWL